MTELLKKAFEQAEQLPLDEQDAFARWVLEELASEKRWADLFGSSQQQLADLAAEALEENRSDRTEPLDPERL
jgi:hypothetical protein